MFRPELLSFLMLLKRSPDVPGPSPDVRPGWKQYNDMTEVVVMKTCRAFPELFEVDAINRIVRLSAEGEVLNKWMDYVPPKAPVAQVAPVAPVVKEAEEVEEDEEDEEDDESE